jgi:hypothetical protein
MKQFLAFVLKEFKHIARDRWTLLILLGIPVAQILLFGFAITTEVRSTPTAVYAPRGQAAREITAELEASPYFSVAYEVTSPQELDSLFRGGHIRLAVAFDPQFDSDLHQTGEAKIQLIADGSDPNQARTLVGYATALIASYQERLLGEHRAPVLLETETRMLYNPQAKSAYNFVPGVMGIILTLICAMMTAIAIVRERELGTMEVLLVSPIRPLYIILAKAVPYFTLSLVNLITILLLSAFVLGVPIQGSLLLLCGISMLYILLALSLGLMISTLVESQVAAILTSGMVLMSPAMIFSGLMFPIESMPTVLQWISTLMPARWYIVAMRKVMIQGSGLEHVGLEVLILTLMTVLLLIVSLRNFKIRLE